MKRKGNRQLRLKKINVSNLNRLNSKDILGGNVPDPTKECVSDSDTMCTRTTVDLSGQRSMNTTPC